MKTLKQYLNDNSPKSIFNKIYSNFLRHDFNESEIVNFSLKFNYLISFVKDLELDDPRKVFVIKNKYNFIEIMLSEFYNKKSKLKLNHLTCEEINHVLTGEVVNKNNISEDILYSYLIWEVLKCFDESKKQQEKKRRYSKIKKSREDLQ